MKAVLRMILKYVDLKGLAKESIDIHLDALLERIVAKSKNTIDDSAKALLYPIVEAELLEMVERIDIEKLLGIKEEEVA